MNSKSDKQLIRWLLMIPSDKRMENIILETSEQEWDFLQIWAEPEQERDICLVGPNITSTFGGASKGVSGGAVIMLMVGTTVAKSWGTGVGTRGGRGGETSAGTTPTGIDRGEGGEATTAVGAAMGIDGGEGRVAKGAEEEGGATLGWEGRTKKRSRRK